MNLISIHQTRLSIQFSNGNYEMPFLWELVSESVNYLWPLNLQTSKLCTPPPPPTKASMTRLFAFLFNNDSSIWIQCISVNYLYSSMYSNLKLLPVANSIQIHIQIQELSWYLGIRNCSPKNENLLKMYSPSSHARCRWICLLIWTDLEKFSMLTNGSSAVNGCRQNESKQLIKTSQ